MVATTFLIGWMDYHGGGKNKISFTRHGEHLIQWLQEIKDLFVIKELLVFVFATMPSQLCHHLNSQICILGLYHCSILPPFPSSIYLLTTDFPLFMTSQITSFINCLALENHDCLTFHLYCCLKNPYHLSLLTIMTLFLTQNKPFYTLTIVWT